jgi:hypothetical protein
MPEFAAELSVLLAQQDETTLAESVAGLWVLDRCRCGAEYCATIYTLNPDAEYTDGLSLFPKDRSVIYIDTVDGNIACIEALDLPEVRKKLLALLP